MFDPVWVHYIFSLLPYGGYTCKISIASQKGGVSEDNWNLSIGHFSMLSKERIRKSTLLYEPRLFTLGEIMAFQVFFYSTFFVVAHIGSVHVMWLLSVNPLTFL